MAMTRAAREMLATKRLGKLDAELKRIADIKAEQDALAAELAALTERVVGPLDSLGKTYNAHGIQFTVISPTLVRYDEAGIRRDLGEEIWEKIKVESMSRDALTGLVSAGVVAAEQVAVHATVTKAKTYVKVTRTQVDAQGNEVAA